MKFKFAILGLFLATTANAQQVRFSLEVNRFGIEVFQLPPRLDIVSHSPDHTRVDIVAPMEVYQHLHDLGMAPQLIEIQKPQVQEEYLTPREVREFIQQAAYQYPDIVHLEEIGRTLMDEPIWAVRLSSAERLDEKPVVLFNSMHHARELMTPEVTLDIVRYITENSSNIETPEVADWLNDLAIWVVPQVNPDGNNIVWTQDSWWRKNARGDAREIWGVDLNRNYPYRWGGCRGSSSNKDSQTYRGESESSEPETQTMMAFVREQNPLINISYHSYSELVISPYGCRGHTPAEVEILDSVGSEMAKLLVKDSGKGTYTYGPAWDELYPVDGDDISWMHLELNTLAYVVEVGSSSNGFQPDYGKWRDLQVERQRPGWIYLLNRAMQGPQVRLKLFDQSTGKPIDGSLRILGIDYKEEGARQSRKGFLTKILTPGVHELEVSAEGYKTTTLRASVGDFPEFINVYLQAN